MFSEKKWIWLGVIIFLFACFKVFGADFSTTLVDNPKVLVNSKIIDFLYTDKNDNENLLIYTNREVYTGLTNSKVYFAIKNESEFGQNIDISFFFSKKNRFLVDVSKFIENSYFEEVSTTTSEKMTGYKDIWQEKELISFSKEQNDLLLSESDFSIKDKKGFETQKKAQYYIDKGETLYFKADIKYPAFIEDEFFIEVIGDKGAYGHLDPTILSDYFQDDFDDLDDWDEITANGSVVEIDPAGQLHLDGMNMTSAGNAKISQVISDWGTGDYWIELYFKIDDNGGVSGIRMVAEGGTNRVITYFQNGRVDWTDGITVYDGVNYENAWEHTWDTNWHTFKAYIHNSQTDMDIYIDDDLKVSDVSVNASKISAGRIQLYGYGSDTDAGEYHIDYYYIGSEEIEEQEATTTAGVMGEQDAMRFFIITFGYAVLGVLLLSIFGKPFNLV